MTKRGLKCTIEGVDLEVPFSIEALLQRAQIEDEFKPSLTQLLQQLHVKQNNIDLLTNSAITRFAKAKDIYLLPFHAKQIARAATFWTEPSLEDVINVIYDKNPNWKCILDVPESPRGVDTHLAWVGREAELRQLSKSALSNIHEHMKRTQTKQFYQIPIIHGGPTFVFFNKVGVGVGKTRLGFEFCGMLENALKTHNPKLRESSEGSPEMVMQDFNNIFPRIAHILLDLYMKDGGNFKQPAPIELGLRIAAHFFFGVTFNQLISALGETRQKTKISKFTFEKVCALITETFARKKQHQGQQLLVTLQLDEFQSVPKARLQEMLLEIGTHITARHELGICIFPILTGTDIKTAIDSMQLATLVPVPLLLLPLSNAEQWKLIKHTLSRIPSLSSMWKEQLFRQFVESLGGVPRFIQIFLSQLQDMTLSSNIESVMEKLMEDVISTINVVYQSSKWQGLLGSHKGISQMLFWALSGHPCRLEDKLNGITVEEARESGFLMLKEVGDDTDEIVDPEEVSPDVVPISPQQLLTPVTVPQPASSPHQTYQILIPLILVRSLNRMIHAVPDSVINHIKSFSVDEFVATIAGLRALRQNLLCSLGRTRATYRELYPHAWGHPEDLDQEISILPVEVFKLESAWQTDVACILSSVHQGNTILLNAPNALSCDALTVHPPQDLEAMQFKSSAFTKTHLPVHSDSDHLELGRQTDETDTIWGELNTAKEFHAKIFDNCRFTLALISNKPLDMNKMVGHQPLVPRNVILVANQNFRKYANCFAHSGVFRSLPKLSVNFRR